MISPGRSSAKRQANAMQTACSLSPSSAAAFAQYTAITAHPLPAPLLVTMPVTPLARHSRSIIAGINLQVSRSRFVVDEVETEHDGASANAYERGPNPLYNLRGERVGGVSALLLPSHIQVMHVCGECGGSPKPIPTHIVRRSPKPRHGNACRHAEHSLRGHHRPYAASGLAPTAPNGGAYYFKASPGIHFLVVFHIANCPFLIAG